MMKVRYPYTRQYRDRHGKMRVEYRRNGRTIPLPSNVGTAEFQAAYDTAKALIEGGQQPTGAAVPPGQLRAGTLRWLCVEYFKSAEFGQLGRVTQEERRRLLEHALREPAQPGSLFLFGDYPAAAVERRHIVVLRDRKKHVPNASNHRLKALRGLFRWATKENKGGIRENPARNVDKLNVGGEGHHTWTEEECKGYQNRHPIGTMERLAFDLFFETCQRLGDVHAMGRQHVRNGKLCFTQEKNRQHPHPMYLELPITPALQKSLGATVTGDLRFLVNAHGVPFASKKSFGNWFRACCDEAGLPRRCTAHGLRKAAATYHADNGASANELMAIFGWKSLRTAEIYVRKANQKKLAEQAMARGAKAKP
jgi:integrase